MRVNIYAEEALFDRAAAMADYFGKAAHALRDLPNVIDIRNYGMVAAVELSSRAGEPTKRAYEVFVRAYEQGVLLRYTGDIIAISPPLIINEGEIDRLFEVLSEAIKTVA